MEYCSQMYNKELFKFCHQLILAIVMRDFESVVRNCDLSNWKEALAIILTYADGKDFVALCSMYAILCKLYSGHLCTFLFDRS